MDTPESSAAQPEIKRVEDRLNLLPPDLRREVLGFFDRIAHNIVAQQTSFVDDEPEVRVGPAHLEFYREQFRQIEESQFLNPHDHPPKKIL